MERCKITKKKRGGIKVEFKKLTPGECLALANAIKIHSQYSPRAQDLVAYMKGAVQEMTGDDETAQLILDRLNEEDEEQ